MVRSSRPQSCAQEAFQALLTRPLVALTLPAPPIPVVRNTAYILHLVLLCLRILFDLVLVWAVASPVVKYLPVSPPASDAGPAADADAIADPTERTGLLTNQASSASPRPSEDVDGTTTTSASTPNGSVGRAAAVGKGRGKGPYGTFGADASANGNESTPGNTSVNPSAVGLVEGAAKPKSG